MIRPTVFRKHSVHPVRGEGVGTASRQRHGYAKDMRLGAWGGPCVVAFGVGVVSRCPVSDKIRLISVGTASHERNLPTRRGVLLSSAVECGPAPCSRCLESIWRPCAASARPAEVLRRPIALLTAARTAYKEAGCWRRGYQPPPRMILRPPALAPLLHQPPRRTSIVANAKGKRTPPTPTSGKRAP